ncbi:MAG: tetratricopeptide repeat protein [Pseudomonadota bacterium]
MTLRHLLLTALLLAVAPAAALELPLWEELTKTQKMLDADRAFVEAMRGVHKGDLKEGARYSVLQGWDAFGKGNMDIAIRRFNQAWLLDPENGEIYWGFAVATHVRGDGLEQSERWFGEAERLIPADAELRNDHGQALEENGEPGRARTYFEKALAIDPDNVLAHAGMARVLTQLGDKAGADRHAAEAKRLKPE